MTIPHSPSVGRPSLPNLPPPTTAVVHRPSRTVWVASIIHSHPPMVFSCRSYFVICKFMKTDTSLNREPVREEVVDPRAEPAPQTSRRRKNFFRRGIEKIRNKMWAILQPFFNVVLIHHDLVRIFKQHLSYHLLVFFFSSGLIVWS